MPRPAQRIAPASTVKLLHGIGLTITVTVVPERIKTLVGCDGVPAVATHIVPFQVLQIAELQFPVEVDPKSPTAYCAEAPRIFNRMKMANKNTVLFMVLKYFNPDLFCRFNSCRRNVFFVNSLLPLH